MSEIGNPKIEIYLPKERIVSNDGTELINEWNFREDLKNDSSWIKLNNYYHQFARFDTITKNYIYAGSFEATENELQEFPLIEDKEILDFDFKTSEITISASGVEKLWSLTPEMNFSRQFILTADKKPILTGYFYSVFSSSYVKHFYIVYNNGYEGLEKPTFENKAFKIEYNPKAEYFSQVDKFDFKQSSEFYDVFKNSGKIAQ